ncbi:MAG TPA: ankyrin repeat domain-containing protein [Gemmatimonadaceae bacterium]|nr:ankyrin repeat domain-containing protein [Gemmatimonadaceae bacterium]
MSDETPRSASASLSLPDAANLDWLRKQAKRRLDELRTAVPDAQLADAQFALAKQYGFSSWRALKAHVDLRTVDGRLFAAARSGDANSLIALLDKHPEKLQARAQPYDMTLLHVAAQAGHRPIVELLLNRGLNVNAREKGDETYAMHWAAAGGRLDIVRRLADAGGDVIGHGDDHALEVIGWATCWDGCDDDAHRAVADFLVSRGARHHIFSAIALDLGNEVRRIVAADHSALDKQMSRNEEHQRPLHFAVRKNRSDMVGLLLELGADPLATDGSGYPATVYATSPGVDRAVLEMIRARGATDLFTVLSLGDYAAAAEILRENPRAADSGGPLHLLAKRNDVPGVRWLLDHRADPNTRWSHWDAVVTPLHVAALQGHADIVRALLDAGADPRIRDSKHDGAAMGWAKQGGHADVIRILTSWLGER